MHDNVYCCHLNPEFPSSGSPYEQGKTLNLTVTEGVPANAQAIKVQIVRLIQPNTLSCVMEVNVLEGLSSIKQATNLILKLYDWRYATQLRHDKKVEQWTPYHEDQYRAFVQEGGAAKFISALEDDDNDDDDDADDDRPWDTARDEAFLFDYCRDLHSCEVEAYSRLRDLQGKNIPRFLADVRFNPSPIQNDLFEVRGILLELITGYSLADLAKCAHQSSWQRICDEAIRTVNLISDHGILNEDVKPRNILIRTHDKDSEYQVVVIDFAQCRFRELDQSEAVWKHEKCRQDEEGAIGFVMAHELNGAFEYRPSYRFLCTCSKCGEI